MKMFNKLVKHIVSPVTTELFLTMSWERLPNHNHWKFNNAGVTEADIFLESLILSVIYRKYNPAGIMYPSKCITGAEIGFTYT